MCENIDVLNCGGTVWTMLREREGEEAE